MWAVHPLLTESVTCVAQRTESLVGLWFLVMFYCVARAADGVAPGRWQAGALAACLLGVFTKEVMAAGPVLAVCYHALLVDGTWRAAFARRGRFFALLALTWLPLALLVLLPGPRYGAGLDEGINPWTYALTQCRAIVLYLKLSFWPHPLVLDYGTAVNRRLGEVWPQAVLLVGLLTATTVGLVRRHPLAFAGAWFFVVLAPSSSVLPLFTQTIAEHRMYLPLAAVIVPVVAGLQMLAGRRSSVILGLVAGVCAALTVQRNTDYRTPLALWQDTVAKAPDNPRAHTNLGNLLDEAGQTEAAMAAYRTALRVQPGYALADHNLANILIRLGRIDEVLAGYREAIRRDPRSANARLNLGNILALQEDWAGALAEFDAAVQIDPADPIAHHNRGNALYNLGRFAEAAAAYERALPRLDSPDLRLNLASALALAGRPYAAIEQLEAAARLDAARADIPYTIAVILHNEGRPAEAAARLRAALKLDPHHAGARELLDRLGR